MTKYIIRICAMLIGLAIAILLLLGLFPYPNLYIIRSAIQTKTVIFAALALSSFIGTFFCCRYLIKEKNAKGFEAIVLLSGFFLCLFSGVLFTNYCGQKVLCSYTTNPSDIEDRLPYVFFCDSSNYYNGNGTVSAFVCFWQGDCGSEEISVTYNQKDFEAEQSYIETVLGPGSQANECTCYTEVIPQLPRLQQIRFYPETNLVVYGRYSFPDMLPSFVPKPYPFR